MKRATPVTIGSEPVRYVLDEPAIPKAPAGGDLDAHFRVHGMYPPAPSWRVGAAAFTVRPDLCVRDVLESVSALLCGLDAITSSIRDDPSVEEYTANALEGVLHLLQQARGLHSLVQGCLNGLVVDVPASQVR